MNRADFQILADERSDDAGSLLKSGRYGCAYYIAGYAVECALKVVIANRTKEGDFPPPPKDVGKYYSHDLQQLLGLTGLQSAFDAERSRDKTFGAYWKTVADWDEQARYQTGRQRLAEDMVAAVRDPDHGVLRWLKRYW